MSDGGKGDKRRPASVSQEELEERWDAIFGHGVFPPKEKILHKPTKFGEVAPKVEGCGWHDDPEFEEKGNQ